MRKRAFLSKLSCFADIANRNPMLDGIRGIAALLVLAEHSGLTPPGTGANGVWLFFVLSGYLLAQPFANRKEFSLVHYIGRRIVRIMPMYSVYVLVAALLFHHSLFWVNGHLLLAFTDDHLWSVKQEMFFYLLLPVVILPVYFDKTNSFSKALVFLLIGISVDQYLAAQGFSLIYNSTGNPTAGFYIMPFMAGIAAAYLGKSIPHQVMSGRWYSYGGLLFFGLPLLTFNWYASEALKHNPAANLFHYYNGSLGVGYALFILWAGLLRDGLVYRFLSNILFRAIGIVGYSFYLWHVAVLTITVPKLLHGHLVHFCFAGVITYLIACITYCLVEKPCMELGKRWKKPALFTTLQPAPL